MAKEITTILSCSESNAGNSQGGELKKVSDVSERVLKLQSKQRGTNYHKVIPEMQSMRGKTES